MSTVCLVFSFFTSTIQISPGTKTVIAYLCSTTDPTAFLTNFEIAPTALSTIAGNASTDFSASVSGHLLALLTAFLRLLHFLMRMTQKQQGLFLLQNTCDSNYNCWAGRRKSSKYWYYCTTIGINKDLSASKAFPMVCVIISTCFWRSFWFCDFISMFFCCLVFKLSSLFI